MGEKNTSLKKADFSCVPAVMAACYSFKRGESDLLDGFKGDELSQAMLCTPNVALNKLNPDNEHNTPTLKDAIKLTDHFNDDRILQAWANSRGYILVEKVEPDDVDEEELLDRVLHLSTTFGNLNNAYHHARIDGIIDPDEYNVILQASVTLRQAVATFARTLETQVRTIPGNAIVIDK